MAGRGAGLGCSARVRFPLLAALLAALPAAIAAAERRVTVDAVVIEGCRQIHPERIRFIMGVRPGRSYELQEELPLALADDVRAIARMGPFADPRTELRFGEDPTRVTVIVRVTELPYVTRIDFTGLEDTWGLEDDLRKAMQTKVGGYANPLQIENDLRLIEQTLRARGHRGAAARLRREETPAGLALTIDIELPRAVKIGRVVYRNLPPYEGPNGITRRRLDAILERTQVNRPGRPWQPELLSLDQLDVVRALQDEGWLDCRLLGVEVERSDYVRPLDERRRGGPETVPDGAYDDRVHIIYDLDPGPRYRLGSVSFVGNSAASSDELRRAFALEEGAWFRRADVAKAVERARRVISNQGYARCRAVQERRIDIERRLVHLTIRLEEGEKYRIGRIDIAGNAMTRDGVIRRAVTLGPGDWWNDDAVDESRRQILRTGLFADDPRRPLSLRPVFPEERPGEADLVISVEEQSTGSLQAQIGYSSATGVFGQFSYSESNFDLVGALTDPLGRWRGGGQTLALDVGVSGNRNSVSASWSEPSLADGPFSLGVTASRVQSSQRDWDERRLSASATVGRAFLRRDLRLSLTYGYFDSEVTDIDLDAPDDARAGSYYANSLGLGVSYDRLDNARLPTRGYALGASGTLYGGLLSATDPMAEYILKADGFLPLLEADDGGVTYLRASVRWRAALPLEDDRLAFYQRYLGGGQAPRHRGFSHNALGPRVINQHGYLARVGGDRDLVATLELSYPFQGINEGVRGIAFLDAGNVWGEDEPLTAESLRYAWGFGVRFPLQFPVSLDFAWLIDPRPSESATQIHFGIGQVRF